MGGEREKKVVKSVVVFDVYEGKKLGGGKKSYGVKLIVEDEEKSLNEKEIDGMMKKLIGKVRGKVNGELR